MILRVEVSEGGSVDGASVLKSPPMGLDEAALAAVSTWRFRPATRDGEPVRVWHDLLVPFRVGESP